MVGGFRVSYHSPLPMAGGFILKNKMTAMQEHIYIYFLSQQGLNKVHSNHGVSNSPCGNQH